MRKICLLMEFHQEGSVHGLKYFFVLLYQGYYPHIQFSCFTHMGFFSMWAEKLSAMAMHRWNLMFSISNKLEVY